MASMGSLDMVEACRTMLLMPLSICGPKVGPYNLKENSTQEQFTLSAGIHFSLNPNSHQPCIHYPQFLHLNQRPPSNIVATTLHERE
jgi:hypothetical protein